MRNRVAWAATFLFTLFVISAITIRSNTIIEHLRLMQITIAVVVITAYGSFAIGALFSKNRPDRVQQLSMGIALGFTATFLQGSWALLWRLGGRPEWMSDSDAQGFFVYLSCLAGVLHITAPGAVDGVVPTRNWIALGCAFGAGFLISAILASWDFDFVRLADALRPVLQNTRP